MNNFLTIFADASFCSETGAAGWAVWIKQAGPSTVVAGQFKRRPFNSGMAELWAMAYGVLEAARLDLIETSDTVMLQSDCLQALTPLYAIGFKDSPKDSHIPHRGVSGECLLSEDEAEAVSFIKDQLDGKKLVMRHVKGHVSAAKGRYWVNMICDREAKRQMKKARGDIAPQKYPPRLL